MISQLPASHSQLLKPDCNNQLHNRQFNSGWITKSVIAVCFLMMLQHAEAQQIICPCGVIVNQGQQCPCHDVYRDADHDNYGNLAVKQSIYNGDPTPNGYVNNSTDCDDADSTTYPGAPELCDGKDNNCNGIIEELYYKDFDGDGLGDPNSTLINCNGQPAGYVSNKNDCNDNDPSIRQAKDWVKDADNDGRYVGTPVTSCSSPGAGYVVKTTQISGDCNDNDPTNPLIIYVNASAVGTHNGTSWANAYLTLQDALANTNTCTKQIWVAAGTYYPDEGGGKTNNDKNASFSMKNGIAIYGGFNGTETYLSQRNWVQNKTILSGDINKDGVLDTSNSLSVISNSLVNNTALLDGFTVTAGYATSFGSGFGGGGMSMGSSSPVIVNCIFSGNKANYGGAIYTAASSPVFKDCSFIGNSAVYEPSSLYGGNGGVLYDNKFANPVGTPTFINCTFSKNTAEHQGDVIWDSVHATITNCVMWGNGTSGGDFLIALNVTYSLLQGYSGGTGNLNNVDPLFVNAATNDFRLQPGSAAINVGLDSMNKEILDLGFMPRKAGVIDMGAYENAAQCASNQWIKDLDGDNYYAGAQVVQCTSPGAGYTTLTTQQPGDCNDNDSLINPKTIWYLDADNDGYKDPNYIGLPSCAPPQDGKHYSITTKGPDCNDNNAAQNPETIWVKDADGDGYYTGNVLSGCLGLVGYKIRTNEQPGDCDDNDASAHPGATEVLNGKDDNCNGQIDEGCWPASNLNATNITQSSATLNWNAGFNGSKYNLSYRQSGTSTWTVVKGIKPTSYNVTALSLYTTYQYKVQTVCPLGAKSAYTAVSSFKTTYGGPAYCATNGETTYEAIGTVVLGSINNTSGNNNGYGDFTSLSTTIAAGTSPKIKLTPIFCCGAYPEFWEVYIDYDHDGLFTGTGEKVAATQDTTTVSKTFAVPLTAKNGYTRMRVMMHYATYLDQPCGSYLDGEAEDYTVNITGGTAPIGESAVAAALNISSLLVMPNPINSSSATAVLDMAKEGNAFITITDVSGRLLYKKDVTNLRTGKNSILLNGLAGLANGTYFIEAKQNGVTLGRTQVVVEK